MFAPLNASMLNTGPASLGLSVIASSNAEIKAITEAQFKNATVRFNGEIVGLAESWGDTLHRTEIGYGIWVAEAEAYQESKADRTILLSSTVCGLADVFAWRLLASYRPANSRRRLILNR